MWIVRLALRQPYTVAVMSFVLMLMGWLAMRSMPVDIFPTIDIPVVAVVWNYNGFSAQDMESRIVLLSERNLSATVNGIERIESESIPGVGLIKIFFQPGVDIGNAIAQITSSCQTALRAMPPGVTPPYVVQSNASSVPVAQITLTSQSMPEQEISDYGQNFIRLQLFTIPGLSTPSPYGGKVREITVDVDPKALAGKGLSAEDVLSALLSSNLLIPAGTARIGDRDYNVSMNSSPSNVADFNNIPVKIVNGAPVLIGDVATVRDGFAEQENIVRIDGRRAAYLTILKKADASTLAVVDAAKAMLPRIRAVAPSGLQVRLDFDQSVFVRAAVQSVVREAIIAAVLVSLMILLFVGSWRSVLIAVTSIPLSIAVAVICLHATGNGFNVMTLGGLSLSIGLLVDNAIVTVENVHRNLSLGKPLTVAILDAAAQISTPLIVATLAICIVFFPVVLLVGPARFRRGERRRRFVAPISYAGEDTFSDASGRRAARSSRCGPPCPRRRHRAGGSRRPTRLERGRTRAARECDRSAGTSVQQHARSMVHPVPGSIRAPRGASHRASEVHAECGRSAYRVQSAAPADHRHRFLPVDRRRDDEDPLSRAIGYENRTNRAPGGPGRGDDKADRAPR
jgi:multidrug efflux pump subunit AcrB